MKLTNREVAIFAVLGTIMCTTKVIMQAIPNVHLLGVFVVAFTVVYRKKALIPIYLYVFANGLWVEGFDPFGWLPELYLWLILWGMVMLLPKNMPRRVAPIVYMLVAGVHGLAFGTLYAPVYALFAGFGWDRVWMWIVAGLPFDIIHAVSNLILGSLIVPITMLLRKLDKKT